MDNQQVEDFYMYSVKIELCDRQDPHNHSTCPYKHPGEACTRRDPRVSRYDSIFCYDLHNNGMCHRGANCPYSHNMHEYFLHPTRFRTRMCEFGDSCVRELCFFAHNEAELRPRVPIKVYSNTRRGGRRARAAPAAPAALTSAADSDGSTSGASTEAGSPLVSILEAPCLPFVAYDIASTADIKEPLTLAEQIALARLSLGAAQPQFVPSDSSPVSRQPVDPVIEASTGLELPLLFLQDMLASEGSSADVLLSSSAFDAAAASPSTDALGSCMLQALPSALDYPFPHDLGYATRAGGSPVARTQSLTQSLLEPMLSDLAGNTGGFLELQSQGSLLSFSTSDVLQASPGTSPSSNRAVSYAMLGASNSTAPLYDASSSVLALPQQQQLAGMQLLQGSLPQLVASSGCASLALPGSGLPVGSSASPGHLSSVTLMNPGPGPAMTQGKRYILVPVESAAGIAASRPVNEPRAQLPLQLPQVNGYVGPGSVLACGRSPAPVCGMQAPMYQAPTMLLQPLQQLL